jgi:hypothetical protein
VLRVVLKASCKITGRGLHTAFASFFTASSP